MEFTTGLAATSAGNPRSFGLAAGRDGCRTRHAPPLQGHPSPSRCIDGANTNCVPGCTTGARRLEGEAGIAARPRASVPAQDPVAEEPEQVESLPFPYLNNPVIHPIFTEYSIPLQGTRVQGLACRDSRACGAGPCRGAWISPSPAGRAAAKPASPPAFSQSMSVSNGSRSPGGHGPERSSRSCARTSGACRKDRRSAHGARRRRPEGEAPARGGGPRRTGRHASFEAVRGSRPERSAVRRLPSPTFLLASGSGLPSEGARLLRA